MQTSDLWEQLGALDSQQAAMEVLVRLFTHYEQGKAGSAAEAEAFFAALRSILAQVDSCNVSRR
ncbi:MAG: hypothetical protein ACOX5Z_12065 [Desulfobulbus sp.]|jgi:hypothetical protein